MERQVCAGIPVRAVFAVSHHGIAPFGKVHPDLVLASGEQMDCQQAEATVLLHDDVFRVGKLTPPLVGGRIDPHGAVLRQIAAYGAALQCQCAVNHRHVVLIRLLPMLLQMDLVRFALGQDQDAGGLPVQAMDDIDPVSGTWIPLADVIVEDGMDRARLVPAGADCQESARFLDDDDVPVFVQDRKPLGVMFSCRHGELSPGPAADVGHSVFKSKAHVTQLLERHPKSLEQASAVLLS